MVCAATAPNEGQPDARIIVVVRVARNGRSPRRRSLVLGRQGEALLRRGVRAECVVQRVARRRGVARRVAGGRDISQRGGERGQGTARSQDGRRSESQGSRVGRGRDRGGECAVGAYALIVSE